MPGCGRCACSGPAPRPPRRVGPARCRSTGGRRSPGSTVSAGDRVRARIRGEQRDLEVVRAVRRRVGARGRGGVSGGPCSPAPAPTWCGHAERRPGTGRTCRPTSPAVTAAAVGRPNAIVDGSTGSPGAPTERRGLARVRRPVGVAVRVPACRCHGTTAAAPFRPLGDRAGTAAADHGGGCVHRALERRQVIAAERTRRPQGTRARLQDAGAHPVAQRVRARGASGATTSRVRR